MARLSQKGIRMLLRTREPVTISIDFFTAQGGRKTQEDRYFIYPFTDDTGVVYGYFAAILDGHGGHDAAEAVRNMLPYGMPTFAHAMRTKTLRKAEVLKTLCSSLQIASQHYNAGTTFICALIDLREMSAHVANLGDSGLLIARKGIVHYKTTPHNARCNKSDRKKIITRGAIWERGYLYFGDRGVQCTRTFGDKWATHLIRTPTIKTIALEEGDRILLFSDGVIRTSNGKHYHHECSGMAQVMQENPDVSADELAVKGMEIQYGSDNATAILMCIRS